jgi:hypothetical protein
VNDLNLASFTKSVYWINLFEILSKYTKEYFIVANKKLPLFSIVFFRGFHQRTEIGRASDVSNSSCKKLRKSAKNNDFYVSH